MTEAVDPAVRAPGEVKQAKVPWRAKRLRYGAASLLAVFLIWEAIVRVGLVNPLFMAAPSAALETGWRLMTTGRLWSHAWVSLQEFIYGFALGVIVGMVLGFAMARWERVNWTIGPTVWGIYSVPRVAFIPLFLVWLGIGMESKVALVFLGVVFPLIANTFIAVRGVDKIVVRAARSFSANGREMLTKVYLPFSVPYLVDGLRLGAGRGLVGVVIAEMYVSSAGIGYLIRLAGLNFRTAELIFYVLLVAVFGILISQALLWLENRFAGWRRAGTAPT
jgi:ABC-type nitrate/sulfonate/bicarbonate transport system permease component